VDSFTHGLIAAGLAYALGLPGLVPFAVAGAVVPDADTLFARAFDNRPSLYLFTHGGIAHSLPGAAVMALPAWAVAALVAPAVPFFPAVAAPLAFAAVLAGAYLHLGLDWLACPGLPLLAPASDTKYTAGLLPGPSILLFGVSIVVLAGMALGVTSFPGMLLPYAGVVAAFLAVRLAAFGLVRLDLRGAGRAVPTISPLHWLVIGETPDAWTVSDYRAGTGTTEPALHPKFTGITAEAAAPFLEAPEARRVRYHSYITTAAREGDALVIADPLRTSGAIRYPPYYAEARVPLRGDAGASPAGALEAGR
jgi:inner membrane protein